MTKCKASIRGIAQCIAGGTKWKDLVPPAGWRGGLLFAILISTLQWNLAQTLATTAIQDTVYRADGTLASGTLIVSWPAFTTAANASVAAGSTSAQIGANGLVSLNLASNAGAIPGGTYYTAVYHLNDGSVNTEYWVVPVAASTTIGEIRSQLVPATVAIQAVSKQYVDTAVSSITGNFLLASGGTMTGELLLSEDPTSPQQAADKHYVDDSTGSLLPLAGGSLTGPLTLAGDPVAALQAATKEYVDANGGNSSMALAAANAAQATANAAVPASKVGVASGVAPLDSTARLPAANMPTSLVASVNTAIYSGSAPYGAQCNWNGTSGADDTSALQAAISAAVSAASSKTYQQGSQVVVVPTGTCKVSGELRIPANITLRGQAKEGSIIEQTSATANAVTVIPCTNGPGGVGGPFGDCEGGISDLTIEGNGHLTAGTLIEVDNVVSYRLQNVRLYNGGGRGLQLNGGSERFESRDLTIELTRWPLVLGQTSNESYFYNTKVLFPGATADGYCFNVNCVNGVYPASGPIVPDPHAAVYNYMGVNVGFYGGSIKSLQMIGGFKTFNSESTSIDHFYFEYGYVNPGVIAGGVPEWTTTTGALTASGFSVPVQSVSWMAQYYNSAGDVPAATPSATSYVIIPPDFLFGSTAASSLGGGILRGSYEIVGIAGFAGNGTFYIAASSRGLSGTTAIAWPAGAEIEAYGTGIESFKLENSHVNAQDAFSAMGTAGANLTRNCDNSGVNTCAEIVAGYVPDGRWVQQRGSAGDNATAPPVSVALSNVVMFSGSFAGVGVVAVHSNVQLGVSGTNTGVSPGEGYSVPLNASLRNITGGAAVSVPTYANGHQPLFTLTDDANHRTVSTAGNMYKQTVSINDSVSHISSGDQIASEYDLMDLPYWALPGAPVLSTGGSLPAGNYSVRAAYTYAGGVGILSPSVMVAVTSGQQFTVPSPPADAASLATGWNVYVGPSGNENLQNGTPIAIGTAFPLTTAPSTNLGIVPAGCSAFCHPLYRFQFLGGPNYAGTSAGIGLHQWVPQTSSWLSKFSVDGNGDVAASGSGSFVGRVSVAGGESVTGGTTTDNLTASGAISAAQVSSGTVLSSQINKVFLCGRLSCRGLRGGRYDLYHPA